MIKRGNLAKWCLLLLVGLWLMPGLAHGQAPQKIYYARQNGGSWNEPKTWTYDATGTPPQDEEVTWPMPKGTKVVLLEQIRPISVDEDVDTDGLEIEMDAAVFLDMRTFKFTNGIKRLDGKGTIITASGEVPKAAGGTFYGPDGGVLVFDAPGGQFNIVEFPKEVNKLVFRGAGTYHFSEQDVTVHGSLTLTGSATLCLGSDARPTNSRKLTVLGDVTLEGTSTLGVVKREMSSYGSGDGYDAYYRERAHVLELHGDLKVGAGAKVNFMPVGEDINLSLLPTSPNNQKVAIYAKGGTSQKFTCDGQVDLYYLVVDKEGGATLVVAAPQKEKFRLMGPTHDNYKALHIAKGVLELKDQACLASLSEGEQPFVLGTGAVLKLNGPGVLVVGKAYNNKQLADIWGIETNKAPDPQTASATYKILQLAGGKILIEQGVLSMGDGEGPYPSSNAGGEIEIKAGGALLAQRMQSTSGGHLIYTQSGGTLVLRGFKHDRPESYRETRDIDRIYTLPTSFSSDPWTPATLSLAYVQDAFRVSGGEIRILGGRQPLPGTAADPLLNLQCSPANYDVSGGKLLMDVREVRPNLTNFTMSSTVPLQNVQILSATGMYMDVTSDLLVQEDITVTGGMTLTFGGRSLTVMRDFTLESGAKFDSNLTLRFYGSRPGKFHNKAGITWGAKFLEVSKSDKVALEVVDASATSSIEKNMLVIGGILRLGASKKISVADTLELSGRIEGGEIMLGSSTVTGNGRGYVENLSLTKSIARQKARKIEIGKRFHLNDANTLYEMRLLHAQ